jgi:sugar phosphate isomerase/epimerase
VDDPGRISIVSDEVSQDLAEVRAFLDAHRLDAIELRCVSGRRVPDLEPVDLETLAHWARSRDPAVVSVSPGLFKCDVGDRDERSRHLRDVLPRSIELAVRLGAEFLVAFSFENLRGEEPGTGPLEALAEAAEACGQAGLPLLVENEPGFLACSGEETAALLDRAGHGNLLVNWDPANAGDLGRDALAAGLRAVFPRVRHVHVKNGKSRPGERFPAYGPLGEGDIDWPAHLALLAALGYRGRFGVETHYEPLREGSATVLSELRAMLRETSTGRSPA